MSDVTIKIEGLEELQVDFRKAASNIKTHVSWAMAQSVNVVKNHAQSLVPYKTGTLRRSIFTEINFGGIQGVVSQDTNIAKYGPHMEYGTKPHEIRPVVKRVLADRRAGIIFGTLVHHPGTAAHPFMRPALEDNIMKIQEYFDAAVLKVVRDMAK